MRRDIHRHVLCGVFVDGMVAECAIPLIKRDDMLNEIRGYWSELNWYLKLAVSMIVPLFMFAVYVFWTVISAVAGR